MKKTITILWVLLVSVGMIFPNLYGSILDTVKFGAISYPTSLDSLENPTPTQSVATAKSHSQQHSDANDAIEAVQAKLGISASTAIADTFLVGNGSGSSIWSTHATGTSIWLSGLGTMGNLLSTGSSTIVGNLNITGNSTSTNATSTILAVTNFATTTNFYGAGLTPCSGGSFLTWTGGQFGCQASGGGTTVTRKFSTVAAGGTYYLAHSYTGVANGNTIEWEATCSRTTTNEAVNLNYRTSNDGATTTVVTMGGVDGLATGFAAFTATTTYSVTVDVTVAQGCDRNGLVLRSRMYNP